MSTFRFKELLDDYESGRISKAEFWDRINHLATKYFDYIAEGYYDEDETDSDRR